MRGRFGLIGIGAAALLAFPAWSQTTTECETFGDSISCETAPNGFYMFGQALAARAQKKKAAELFGDALRNGRCDEARQLAMQYGTREDVVAVQTQCVTPEAAAARSQEQVVASIVREVRQGRCDRAKALALEAGRLDMADQVVRVCTPAPASPNPPAATSTSELKDKP